MVSICQNKEWRASGSFSGPGRNDPLLIAFPQSIPFFADHHNANVREIDPVSPRRSTATCRSMPLGVSGGTPSHSANIRRAVGNTPLKGSIRMVPGHGRGEWRTNVPMGAPIFSAPFPAFGERGQVVRIPDNSPCGVAAIRSPSSIAVGFVLGSKDDCFPPTRYPILTWPR